MSGLKIFSQDEIDEIINFTLTEKTPFAYGWQYLIYANKYIAGGHFDKAVIVMAVLLAYTIRVSLHKLLHEEEDYKRGVHENLVRQVFMGKNPSFNDRLYTYGSGLLSVDLDENLIKTVKSIYSAKNALSKGNKLEDTELYKSFDSDEIEKIDFFKDLLRDCQKIFEAFVDEFGA